MAFQCLNSKAKKTTKSIMKSVQLHVLIKAIIQLATVDTKTKMAAITASSTLINFRRTVRAVTFSKPSSCLACSCCCSTLNRWVRQASRDSYRGETKLSEGALMINQRSWKYSTDCFINGSFPFTLIWLVIARTKRTCNRTPGQKVPGCHSCQ